MNKIEINGHTEIYYEGLNCTYVLSSIFNNEHKYVMPSLQFSKNYGMINEKSLDYWDNSEYLIKLYKKVIKPWVKNIEVKSKKRHKEFLKEEFTSLEDYEGIYELFNRAFELGML